MAMDPIESGIHKARHYVRADQLDLALSKLREAVEAESEPTQLRSAFAKRLQVLETAVRDGNPKLARNAEMGAESHSVHSVHYEYPRPPAPPSTVNLSELWDELVVDFIAVLEKRALKKRAIEE